MTILGRFKASQSLKLVCISLLLTNNGFSQIITLIDSATNQAIDEVFISSKSYPRGVLTDDKGQADLTAFKSEEYLKFLHASFDIIYLTKEEAIAKGDYKAKRKGEPITLGLYRSSIALFSS